MHLRLAATGQTQNMRVTLTFECIFEIQQDSRGGRSTC